MASRLCTRCGAAERVAGVRSTWCRDCKTEWQRGYRAGVRLFVAVPKPVRDQNGCLVWQGRSILPNGYAVQTKDGQSDYIHRHAFREAVGPIPGGMTVDHVCEQKLCIEPTHLELCTRSENTKRYYERRRA